MARFWHRLLGTLFPSLGEQGSESEIGAPSERELRKLLRRLRPVSQNLYEALGVKGTEAAEAAVDRLAESGPAVVPHLVELLQKGHVVEQWNAAKVIARMGPQARDALAALMAAIEGIPADRSEILKGGEYSLMPIPLETMFGAIAALGCSDESVAFLLKFIHESKSDSVRKDAALALEEIGFVPDDPTLCDSIRSAKSLTSDLEDMEPERIFSGRPIEPRAKARTAAAPSPREPRDRTIMATAISDGTYRSEAGTEKIGYFDPNVAPFATLEGNRTGLITTNSADALLEVVRMTGGDSVVGSFYRYMVEEETKDPAVNIAVKLNLASTSEVLDLFQEMANDQSIREFLLVTTTMPFFLKYSVGKVVMLVEVEHELKLNTLANLLLNDPEFASVHSVAEFKAKAQALLNERVAEFRAKREWAVREMDKRDPKENSIET